MAGNQRIYKFPTQLSEGSKVIIKGLMDDGFTIAFMSEDDYALYSLNWQDGLISEDSFVQETDETDLAGSLHKTETLDSQLGIISEQMKNNKLLLGCVGIEFMFDDNTIYKYAISSSGEKTQLPEYDLNFNPEEMSFILIDGNLTVKALEFQFN